MKVKGMGKIIVAMLCITMFIQAVPMSAFAAAAESSKSAETVLQDNDTTAVTTESAVAVTTGEQAIPTIPITGLRQE